MLTPHPIIDFPWLTHSPLAPSVLARLLEVSRHESHASYESLTGINNAILRRHFYELTEEFLLPFRKYYTAAATPVPLHAMTVHGNSGSGGGGGYGSGERANPYLHPPALPPFKEAIFLGEVGAIVFGSGDYSSGGSTSGNGSTSASASGSASGSSGSGSSSSAERYPLLKACGLRVASLSTLYQRFFRSPHFYPWLNSRRKLAQVRVCLYSCVSVSLCVEIHSGRHVFC